MSTWEERSQAFEDSYESGRTAKDIWKYIPKRLLDSGAVATCFADSEGYWVQLDFEEGGWRAYDYDDDCGIIHEYTIKELREALKTVKQVNDDQ